MRATFDIAAANSSLTGYSVVWGSSVVWGAASALNQDFSVDAHGDQ